MNQLPATSSVDKLKVTREGDSVFRMLKVELEPMAEIVTEPGAMASQEIGIQLRAQVNGGFVQALIARLLGGESFFINIFRNVSQRTQTLYLAQPSPGEILEGQLRGETIFIQPGAFIACTAGIRRKVKWAGFSSWIAGEGLFRLAISGHGRFWYGAYGAVVEKEVRGDYIVDSGHLLSYPPTVTLKIQLSSGIFSSLFGGEGFVLRLSGHGKIQLQTRSINGLAGWLNPRFY